MAAVDGLSLDVGEDVRFGTDETEWERSGFLDQAVAERPPGQPASGEPDSLARYEAALLTAEARNRRPATINFQRLKKLSEPYRVVRTLDIFGQLPGEGTVLLRLEALRSVGKSGYDIAVYHRQTISVPPACPRSKDQPENPKVDVEVWVANELIHSVLPSPEKALEQVLAWLDMRCQ
jgi:hypothetical protein